MFEVKVEDRAVMAALGRLEQSGRDMSPLMRAIRTELADQTEQNFADEGRPKWRLLAPLAPSTIEYRKKRGSWPGMIMQDSGQLAASYTSGSDKDSAWIGSNKVYAAIQNLGGQAGRGHHVNLPARPQVPVDIRGTLQPEAEDAILRLVNNYLADTADH